MSTDSKDATSARERARPTGQQRIPRWWLVLLLLAVFMISVGITAAFQPRVANHFGYALPGKDGLPTYIFANGRRYQSLQVCAGADWCGQSRLQQLIPRCYTQANLVAAQQWPLVRVGTMFTLFGTPQPILAPARQTGLTRPLVMADGADCYVVYTLEGGP